MTSLSGLRGVALTGTGSAVPSRLVFNGDLAVHLGHEVAAGIADTHGVDRRYWCGSEESTADLAEEAARAAIMAAGIEPHEVGLLVVATDTPEYISPPTAAVVHGRLELGDARAFDVSAGGADFIAALELAAAMLRVDPHVRHAVVVGVSAMSKYLDTHDVRTAPVYGDAAGAVLLSAAVHDSFLAVSCRTMGQHSLDVGVFAGGTRTPTTHVVLDAALQNRLRVLRGYPDSLPEAWAALVRSTMRHPGGDSGAVMHWRWAHPSVRALVDTARLVGDESLLDASLQLRRSAGYTGAAALPFALDEAVKSHQFADGDLVLLTAAGAGVSLGVALLQWTGDAPA